MCPFLQTHISLSFSAQCVDIIKWLTYFCLHTKMYAHINHLYIHRNQTHKASVCRKTDRRKCGEKSVLFPQTVVFIPLHSHSSPPPTSSHTLATKTYPETETFFSLICHCCRKKITLMILVVDKSVRVKKWTRRSGRNFCKEFFTLRYTWMRIHNFCCSREGNSSRGEIWKVIIDPPQVSPALAGQTWKDISFCTLGDPSRRRGEKRVFVCT